MPLLQHQTSNTNALNDIFIVFIFSTTMMTISIRKGSQERADLADGGVLGRPVGITRLGNILHISTNETILGLAHNTILCTSCA